MSGTFTSDIGLPCFLLQDHNWSFSFSTDLINHHPEMVSIKASLECSTVSMAFEDLRGTGRVF